MLIVLTSSDPTDEREMSNCAATRSCSSGLVVDHGWKEHSIRVTMTTASPRLPLYAHDGRAIQWNADRSAAMFDSTNDEYHSDADAVSASFLKKVLRSPAHALAGADGEAVELDSQRLGTAVHTLALEPARFKAEYALYDRRRGTTDFELFCESHPGKTILTRKEFDRVVACAAAVRGAVAVEGDDGTYTIDQLLTSGFAVVERNLYWVDAESGLTCRARPDLMVMHLTFDLKTTDDARALAFSHQCHRLHYDLQAAFYLRGRKAFDPDLVDPPFLFVAAETRAPCGVQVHVADRDEFVEVGDKKVQEALSMVRKCRDANFWPGYPRPNSTLKIPLNRRYPVALDI